MKTRKEIENRIAELDAIIADDEKISDENRALYYEAHRKLEAELTGYLKDAGYPVDERTMVDTRMMYDTKTAYVSFKTKGSAEFNITFKDKKVTDASATGISSRGATPEDLAEMGSYYKIVAQVMEKINSDMGLSLFFEAIEKFTEPKFRVGVDNIYNIKTERKDLENQLKVLSLELEVGKTVEVYFEGTRRSGSRWREATIERLTEKMVYVNCHAYGTKAINRNDVLYEIRNIAVAG